ncbi:hypothetical protein CSAL01_11150 [Colletotrichum salicis]|uniref:Uncharacterized protein n=1 Tax=Colletotrichum salicis TaxID=1209931 RepID=A0A135UZW2_9PEZI|nr:hypothetical protein CSAL01_11150 [Colletotrichum salicis]
MAPSTATTSKIEFFFTDFALLGSPHLSDRDCVMSTLFGMLFACHRSYLVATRALKFIKPSHPFLLRGGDSSSYTLILRGGDSLGAYHMEVDAMEDVLILNTGWQWPCRLISTAGVFRLHVPTPLRCLALAWPGPHQVGPSDGPSSFYNSEALNGLLTLWGSRTLRTLYVVVDPVHLQDYLASLEVDKSSQAQYPFQRGNRRYFEVSAEQVARSGGLGEVVELLESARRRLTPTVSPGVHQEHVTQALESETTPCRWHAWRDVQTPGLVFRSHQFQRSLFDSTSKYGRFSENHTHNCLLYMKLRQRFQKAPPASMERTSPLDLADRQAEEDHMNPECRGTREIVLIGFSHPHSLPPPPPTQPNPTPTNICEARGLEVWRSVHRARGTLIVEAEEFLHQSEAVKGMGPKPARPGEPPALARRLWAGLFPAAKPHRKGPSPAHAPPLKPLPLHSSVPSYCSVLATEQQTPPSGPTPDSG